jgi:oxygen-independent coproporphyrinogen-3 oxidase
VRASLYLHIPFCQRKCSYCDFVSFESPSLPIHEYGELLRTEMADAARRFAVTSVATVYLGGGTPSLLLPPVVAGLLQAVADHFPLESDLETTMEVNPGTVTPESLAGYRQAGVNRLSIGVQSFDDRELLLLGRIHSSAEALATFHWARRAGFTNISLDLMHSLPGQTLGRWRETLGQAVDLAPEHLSAYGLSIESGTPLAAMASRGELASIDPEVAADMFELTVDSLQAAGYEQYEISNFARHGFRSRHNQVYWRRGNYLGFGAGAHSFLAESGFGLRWENPPDLTGYAAQLQGARDRVEQPLSAEEAMAEFFFLGLRLLEGVDLAAFAAQFGTTAEAAFPGVIERFVANGLLCRQGERLCFSRRGIMLANRVLAEFL